MRLILCLLATGFIGLLHAQANDAPIRLVQDPEVVVEHQRLAGNTRAQAKRRGAIRSVPHLFVYHRDRSPAFHMDGIRPGFDRQLELLIGAFRVDRSMVKLEQLIDNALPADDSGPEALELPRGRIIMVVYRRDECASCDELEVLLDAWLADHPSLDPVRIEIALP